MSLEQAIHLHWSVTRPLTDLAAADSVFTGQAKGSPALPYVALERAVLAPNVRTSTGSLIENLLVRFHVWSDDLDHAKRIALAIQQAFAQADLDWPGGRTLDFRPRGQSEEQTEHGVWRVVVEFQTRVLHTR